MEEEKMQREMDFMLTGTLTAAEAKKSWRYEKDEKGNLILLGYKGKETEVEVPTAIDKDPVTAIGDYAFSPNGNPLSKAQREERRNIRSIRVPEGVKIIGKSAFEDCAGLEQVALPASVRKIGGSSYLPGGYKPKPKKTDDPFSGCPALTTVLVAEDNRWYCVEDGLLCRKSRTGKKMLHYVGGGEGVCIVPEGTKTIPEYFFKKRGDLTAVILPEGVDKIGSCAFQDCTGLTSVTLPEGLTGIEWGAFYGCTGLPSITIPAGVTKIDGATFCGCTRLTSMMIPESVVQIAQDAFDRTLWLKQQKAEHDIVYVGRCVLICRETLTHAAIREGTTQICNRAFSDCTGLTDLTIPASVTEIGWRAFRGCEHLTIHAPAGSYAQQYAEEHHIPFAAE